MTLGESRLVTAFPQKPFEVERAEGSILYTSDGRRLVDLGGASHGVANFGHNHPRIAAAIQEQLWLATHVSSTIPNAARRSFLERLHELVPAHLTRTFMANSGTEAVEAAIKFAAVQTGRRRIVAVRNAFHGRTLGALSATHRAAYREPWKAFLQPVDFVPANDTASLEAAITDETALVLVEPVQGEGGLTVLHDGFLRAAQDAAHAHGALFAVDEIQTGLGRTGRDLASDGRGLRPDMVLLGKSLAGGLPIGVTSMTEEVARAMPPAGHGNTFGGSPLVCAAAAAALGVLRDEHLSLRAEIEGERFRRALEAIASPIVREIRGAGLMLGIDLRIKTGPVLSALLSKGFLALPAGSTVLRFLPPLNIGRTDLEAATAALREVLTDPALLPSTELAA